MRNKYITVLLLTVLALTLGILVANNGADSGKLVYVPPKGAETILETASVKNLDVITSEVEEKALINTVVDTYLKKYFTNPTQSPEADTKQGVDDQPTANDIYTYTFFVKANDEDILVKVQRQENLWQNVSATSVKDPSKTYSQDNSLRADTGFEGN